MTRRAGAMFAWVLPYCLPALVAVWSAHVVLTELGDPLGIGFDIGLWIVASILHLPALAGVLVALSRAHALAYRNRRLAARALLIGSVAGVSLVVALAATRGFWAPLLRNSAVVYFAPASPSPGGAEAFRQGWLEPWRAGYVTVIEAGLMIVLSALHACCAYFIGNKPLWSGALASVAGYLVLAAYLAWCPWFSHDYDNFHGDILAGALVWDPVLLVASDPYTTLALSAHLTTWLSCLAFVRLAAPRR